MPRRRHLSGATAFATAVLATAACTTAVPDAAASSNAPPATTAATWKASMAEIGTHWKVIETALKQNPVGNLRAVADAANDAAGLMRHGYGKFEDKRIPGFARLARDAESWLLRIALEARQDQPDLAVALFREGEAQHCGKCHEAAKPFFEW